MRRLFAIRCLAVLLALAAHARTRPQYGGTLRIETAGDPWQPDGIGRQLVLDTLTTISDTGAAQPVLALRWSAQNDSHRWQFTLRPNVHFQDGQPLTSETVAAALNAVCSSAHPPCPWRIVRPVADTVVFVSDSALPDLPDLLAQSQFAIERKDSTGAVIGTGPFRVAGFVNGALTFAANDDCWAGRPFLDSIELRLHRSVHDQWLDLSVGRADVVEVPPERIREAQQQHLNVLQSRPIDLLALTLASTGIFAGPFASREIRQAVALAVDRSALYNVIFQKQGEISASLLPQWISGDSFLFSTTRDLNGARSLRAGTSSPLIPLVVSSPSGSTLDLAAQRIALDLHEAGFSVQAIAAPAFNPHSVQIDLELIPLESATPRAALDEIGAHLGQNGTVNGTDPGAVWKSEKAMLDNQTVIPLLWLPRAWAASKRVRDLRLSAIGQPLWADASLEYAK